MPECSIKRFLSVFWYSLFLSWQRFPYFCGCTNFVCKGDICIHFFSYIARMREVRKQPPNNILIIVFKTLKTLRESLCWRHLCNFTVSRFSYSVLGEAGRGGLLCTPTLFPWSLTTTLINISRKSWDFHIALTLSYNNVPWSLIGPSSLRFGHTHRKF